MSRTGKPPGLPRTGGRKPGTKNREIPDKKILAEHILETYMAMGGPAFLLEWSKANPTDFVKYALSRFWPAMPRAEETGMINQVNVQIDTMSQWEKARRVGFMLSRAAHELENQKTLEHQPAEPLLPLNSVPAPSQQTAPEPVDITNYPGKLAGEQGFKKRNLI